MKSEREMFRSYGRIKWLEMDAEEEMYCEEDDFTDTESLMLKTCVTLSNEPSNL